MAPEIRGFRNLQVTGLSSFDGSVAELTAIDADSGFSNDADQEQDSIRQRCSRPTQPKPMHFGPAATSTYLTAKTKVSFSPCLYALGLSRAYHSGAVPAWRYPGNPKQRTNVDTFLFCHMLRYISMGLVLVSGHTGGNPNEISE